MPLFHFNGCECRKCCGVPNSGGKTIPTANPFMPFSARREPSRSEAISGRVNVRPITQPAMRYVTDAPRNSDVWNIGKDASHTASRSQIAFTATPAAYHAVMRDDFIAPMPAPNLRSGIILGGQSGIFYPHSNIEDTPSVAYGDMVYLTATGKVVRGG